MLNGRKLSPEELASGRWQALSRCETTSGVPTLGPRRTGTGMDDAGSLD
jgi:hypothetical protein